MAAVTSKWTGFLAVVCSHGKHIDSEAKKNLGFRFVAVSPE